MKKKLTYIFFIFLVLSTVFNTFAQNNQQLSDEQRKEQLKKKIAKLSQQELIELERQAELKEREVKALQEANYALENSINKTEPPKTVDTVSVQPLEQTNGDLSGIKNGPQATSAKISDKVDANTINPNITVKPVSSFSTTKPSALRQPAFTINCAVRNAVRPTVVDETICKWAMDALTLYIFSDYASPLEFPLRKDVVAPVILSELLRTEKIPLDTAARDFLIKAEDARIDKQVGSDSKSSGTTSLAVKGGVPAFFNWAVENGAATSTTSGFTTTFRVNPAGLADVLKGEDPVSVENADESTFWKYFKKSSAGITFDLSRGSTPNVFTGDKQQISAISFRYEFINERNDYKKRLKEFFASNKPEDYSREQLSTFDFLFTRATPGVPETLKTVEGAEWFKKLNVAAKAKGEEAAFKAAGKTDDERLVEIEKLIKENLAKLPLDSFANDKGFVLGLKNFVASAKTYLSILDRVRKGQVFTFEYTNNREVNAPDTSNLRLIYESNVLKSNWDFTLNGSLTFYHKKPVGTDVKKIKDFNLATQLDIPFSLFKKSDIRKTIFTAAFKYQRLMGDAVALDGTVLPNTKGDIVVGQAKVSFPLPFIKGIRFPISATFANRTELVREKEVRGNFGFTFDIDTLWMILRGASGF